MYSSERGPLPVFAALFSILAGSLVLAGWQFDIIALKSLSGSMVPMNPLTAVGFILSGLALLAYLKPDPYLQAAARILSMLVFMAGLLKLLSFWGPDTGVDRFLFREALDRSALQIPNRMAPNTAFGFFTLGLALGLLNLDRWLSQLCTLFALVTALVALTGYLYGVSPLAQVSYFIPMALNTAITFIAVTGGILAYDPASGFMRLALSGDAGGILIRRMLPVVVFILLVFGWLTLGGLELGLYGNRYGIALLTVSSIVTLAAIIFWNARTISGSSRQMQQLNSQLEANVRELSFVNQELESFSYSVSHDLRAPLRSIAGFSEILRETELEKLGEEGRDALQRIVNSADRMGKLIDGLLELSRQGRKDLRKQKISLSKIADRLTADLRKAEPHRNVEVSIASDLTADGDAQLIEVVLQNLLGNAWKYSSKNPSAVIRFGETESRGKKVFFVADNGAGFDMTYAGKLFGAFQRYHSQSEFEGTGIGLATVQRIVRRHGGEIWADAKPGEGATFYFHL